MANPTGFSAELMAPCGMNCTLCSAYLAGSVVSPTGTRKMTTCAGCRPRGKNCAFIKRDCERLSGGTIGFCCECPTFPCEKLRKLDSSYRRKYSYSMIDTLQMIKDRGLEATLEEQRERYKCQRCGGVLCIHNGKCYHCDEVKSWRG
jgi:hypothetical protein